MKILKQNAALHFVTALAILAQTIMHGFAWALVAKNEVANRVLGFGASLFSTSIVALTTTCVAGFWVAQIKPERIPQIRSAALFLFLLESLKNSWVYGLTSFFNWDFMHLAAVCIYFLSFLHFVTNLWLVLIFLSAWIFKSVIFLQPWYSDELFLLPLNWNYQWIQFLILTFISGCVCYWIAQTKKMPFINMALRKRFQKIIFFIFCLGSFGFYWKIFNSVLPEGVMPLMTLPLGAVFGDSSGQHIWPLFPWLSCFIFGFLFSRVVGRTRMDGEKLAFVSIIVGSFIFLIYQIWLFPELAKEVDSQHVFSFRYFNRHDEIVLGVIGCFLFCWSVGYYLEKFSVIRIWSRRFSKASLFIYLFGTSLAIPIAHIFNFLPIQISFYLYPIFLVILSAFIAVLVDRNLNQKIWNITLVASTGERPEINVK